MQKRKNSKVDTAIIVAVIGAVATVAVALITNMNRQPVPSPTPQPSLIIDSLESTFGWTTYTDGKSPAMIQISPVTGKTGNGLEVSYTIEQGRWVGIFREISPDLLVGTDAIRLSYKGSGVSNTIELKLLVKIDDEHSAVFSVLRSRASNTRDWTILEVSYPEFICWTDTGCNAGDQIDLSKVWKLDVAISNKSGDTAGSGTIIFDDIQAITH